MNSPARGVSSLTSMVTALALSIVPLLLLASTGSHLRASQTQSYLITSQIIVHQHLRDIVRASEAAGFFFPPRIHPQGRVTLANGEILLLSTTPALFPDRLSDAITWYENDLSSLFKIDTISLVGADRATYGCCPVFEFFSAPASEKSLFLAVTRDGLFELKEVAERARGKAGCFSFTLEPHESILGLEREKYEVNGARFILPIKRINSLYRDSEGTLRLISTRGAEVIENQPIREKAPVLRYRLTATDAGISILEATIESISQKRKATHIELPIRGLTLSYLNLFTYL